MYVYAYMYIYVYGKAGCFQLISKEFRLLSHFMPLKPDIQFIYNMWEGATIASLHDEGGANVSRL